MSITGYRRPILSPWCGFRVNQYDFAPLEIADHWFPDHVVAVDTCTEPFRRFWYEGGAERQSVVHSGFVSLQYPGELRRFRWDGRVQTTAVTIPPETIRRILPDAARGRDVRLFARFGFANPMIRDLVLRLYAELVAGCPTGLLYGESLCENLVRLLVQNYAIDCVRLPQSSGGLSKVQLSRVLDYIDAFIGCSLNVDEIAGVADLSSYHFGKMFKQSTGVSLHQYVLWRRIRRGQELLNNRRSSLADVAAAVGFSNQSHFTTVFTRTLGITPGAYRKCRN